jgi:hypothetical protein
VLTLASACAQPAPVSAPAQVRQDSTPTALTAEFVQQKTEVAYDPYTKIQVVRGPLLGSYLATGYYLLHNHRIGDSITLGYTSKREDCA